MKNRFTYVEKFNIITDKKTGKAYKLQEPAIIGDGEAYAPANDDNGKEFLIIWTKSKNYDKQDGGTYADREHPARITYKGDDI
jgi:hypothetical protein